MSVKFINVHSTLQTRTSLVACIGRGLRGAPESPAPRIENHRQKRRKAEAEAEPFFYSLPHSARSPNIQPPSTSKKKSNTPLLFLSVPYINIAYLLRRPTLNARRRTPCFPSAQPSPNSAHTALNSFRNVRNPYTTLGAPTATSLSSHRINRLISSII